MQLWVQNELKKRFGSSLYIFKVPQGQYTSRRGIPDLCMSIYGRAYFIEVKMPNGKLTPLQQHELQLINASGATAFAIYGKDKSVLDAFTRMIKHEQSNRDKKDIF